MFTMVMLVLTVPSSQAKMHSSLAMRLLSAVRQRTTTEPTNMIQVTILYLSMVNQQVGLQPLILQLTVTSMRHSARAWVHSQPRPLRVQPGLSTLTAMQRLQVTIMPLRQQLLQKATLFLRLSTSLHLKARHWSSLTFSAMLQEMVQPLRE